MWKWNDLKRLLTRKSAPLDTRDLAAIMWPVGYPDQGHAEYNPRQPHVTVIYFGDISGDIGYTKEDVLDVIRETSWNAFLWMKVDGIEWLGPDQNVPVLRVSHSYLEPYWESIKAALRARGIPFDETYPEYKPHVTITDKAALDDVYPSTLITGPVELWWGDVHYNIDDRVKTKWGTATHEALEDYLDNR